MLQSNSGVSLVGTTEPAVQRLAQPEQSHIRFKAAERRRERVPKGRRKPLWTLEIGLLFYFLPTIW